MEWRENTSLRLWVFYHRCRLAQRCCCWFNLYSSTTATFTQNKNIINVSKSRDRWGYFPSPSLHRRGVLCAQLDERGIRHCSGNIKQLQKRRHTEEILDPCDQQTERRRRHIWRSSWNVRKFKMCQCVHARCRIQTKSFLKHPFGSISSCSTWFVTVWDLSNTVANNKNSCIQYMIGYCVTINSNINSSYTITYRSKRENNSNGINIQWDHKSSSETYGHMDLHWGELKGPFLWKLNGYCKCAGDILVEMSSLWWLWQEYVVTKIFGNIFLALPRRGGDWINPIDATARQQPGK